ncbi:MAG: hypothetical protein JST47_00375 [Bacteroidetes bacterium]|nr:hypothetical protein [Bacteroidota bacterium]MBS1974685.1 hypothetical protein [Bacteroidota bacterium]
MKKTISLVLLALTAACNTSPAFKKAEDAQDAGREFIRATLDGNYEKAKYYMLGDSTNNYMLDKWKSGYDKLTGQEKDNYKNSDIIVFDVHPLNDSVTFYKYFNSYKKDTTIIQIQKVHDEWVVDLKQLMNNTK